MIASPRSTPIGPGGCEDGACTRHSELRLGSVVDGVPLTVRALPGSPSAVSVFHRKSALYGAFVWARRSLNSPKRWFRPGQCDGVHPQLGTVARMAALLAK